MFAKLLYLVTFVISSLMRLTAVIFMKVRFEAKEKNQRFFLSLLSSSQLIVAASRLALSFTKKNFKKTSRIRV